MSFNDSGFFSSLCSLYFLPLSPSSALSGPPCLYRYIYIYIYKNLRGRPPIWREIYARILLRFWMCKNRGPPSHFVAVLFSVFSAPRALCLQSLCFRRVINRGPLSHLFVCLFSRIFWAPVLCLRSHCFGCVSTIGYASRCRRPRLQSVGPESHTPIETQVRAEPRAPSGKGQQSSKA